MLTKLRLTRDVARKIVDAGTPTTRDGRQKIKKGVVGSRVKKIVKSFATVAKSPLSIAKKTYLADITSSQTTDRVSLLKNAALTLDSSGNPNIVVDFVPQYYADGRYNPMMTLVAKRRAFVSSELLTVHTREAVSNVSIDSTQQVLQDIDYR